MNQAPKPDRINELLSEEAVFGLPSELKSELDTLLLEAPEHVTDEYEQAAAVYYMASAPLEIDTLPESLRQRVLGCIPTSQESPDPEVIASVASPTVALPTVDDGGVARRTGWLLAMAASLLLGLWLGNPSKLEKQSLAEARATLIESADSITQVSWTGTETPEAVGATGDVVWSDTDQQGYMTFRGLAPNDPAKEQYQLWIFDAERDDKYPVDGGVFDIPEDTEEVITPITAKIAINKAVLFAITIEKPGGVVVSDRSRLPLLAKVE